MAFEAELELSDEEIQGKATMDRVYVVMVYVGQHTPLLLKAFAQPLNAISYAKEGAATEELDGYPACRIIVSSVPLA